MAVKIKWNQYETALLIDACIKVLNKDIDRRTAVRELSRTLRMYAKRVGIPIDDIYRNENGISFQMRAIENLFGVDTGFERRASHLFEDMVNLYKSDPASFSKILDVAKGKYCGDGSRIEMFYEWASEKASASTSELCKLYETIDAYGISKKFLSSSLLETTEIKTVETLLGHISTNKVFKLTHLTTYGKLIESIQLYLAFLKNCEGPKESSLGKPISAETVPCDDLIPGKDANEKKNAVSAIGKDDEIEKPILDEHTLANKLFVLLRSISQDNQFGTTSAYLASQVAAPVETVERILGNAEWAIMKYQCYKFCENKKSFQSILDFKNIPSLSSTKPSSICYCGELHEGFSSWRRLYAKVIELLYRDFPEVLEDLASSESKKWIVDDRRKNILRVPRKISEHVWIELNRSADGFVRSIKKIIRRCKVDFGDVVIAYQQNQEAGIADSTVRRTQIKRNPTTTIHNDAKEAFENWMVQENHLANVTAGNYSSAIAKCEQILSQINNHDTVLYGMKYAEAKKQLDIVANSALFSKANQYSHNQLTAGIKQFLDYLAVNQHIDKAAITAREKSTLKTSGAGKDWIAKEKLAEEKSLIVDSRIGFMKWMLLTKHIGRTSATINLSCISKCEQLLKELGRKSYFLYGQNYSHACELVGYLTSTQRFREANQRQHNELAVALKGYLSYLSREKPPMGISGATSLDKANGKEITIEKSDADDVSLDSYRNILRDNFPKGFRIPSSLDAKKFIKFHNERYNTNLDAGSETVQNIVRNKIRRVGIVYNDYAFSIENLVSDETKTALLQYVEEHFKNGICFIYYSAIFQHFNDAFLNEQIYSPEMLRLYLKHEFRDRYAFYKDYMSSNRNVQVNPEKEVAEILISNGSPMKTEKIEEELTHIPKSNILSVLQSRKEFVSNAPYEYFHISLIDLSNDELKQILKLALFEIENNKFISGNELIGMIRNRYPGMLERFPQFSDLGIRNAIAYKLGSELSFRGNIISSPHLRLSVADIFSQFAGSHQTFTLAELIKLKKDMHSNICFEAVYENSLRISQEQFVSKEQACFDVAETDKAINAFCQGDYIPLQEIAFFGTFPSSGFRWNVFLLESYVAKYSSEYMLLHKGFSEGKCLGAIVRKSSHYKKFDELLVDVLANAVIKLTTGEALQYLCDRGYIGFRQYSGIDAILAKAQAKKGR